MATSLRTMLTTAGFNVAGGSMYTQPGVWLPPKPGSQRVDTNASIGTLGTQFTNTSPIIDKRIVTAFDMPRAIAFDSTYTYIPVCVSNQVPKFVKIPQSTVVVINGTYQIPVITDIDVANWGGYQGVI